MPNYRIVEYDYTWLQRCPYAKEFLPGGSQAASVAPLTKAVQEACNDKNVFVVQTPVGVGYYSKAIPNGQWFEVWLLLSRDPLIARRMLTVSEEGTGLPIGIDNRTIDRLIAMDRERIPLDEAIARETKARMALEQIVKEKGDAIMEEFKERVAKEVIEDRSPVSTHGRRGKKESKS